MAKHSPELVEFQMALELVSACKSKLEAQRKEFATWLLSLMSERGELPPNVLVADFAAARKKKP